MPNPVERKIARRGGALRFYTVERGGKLFRGAVTRRAGPDGGRTVEWEVRKQDRPRGPIANLFGPGGFLEWFIHGRAKW